VSPKKPGLQKAVLSYTQDQAITTTPIGFVSPKKRGQDTWSTADSTTLQEIETLRKRNPLVFRMVDFYDKITMGTGVTITCEDEAVLVPAMQFWKLNDGKNFQHQAAVELAGTGNAYVWVPPIDKEMNAKDDFATVPKMVLIPSCQIERIATKDGKVWYYRWTWEELKYPDPTTEVKEGTSTITIRQLTKYRDIPAEQMNHVALNRGAGELRGVSMIAPSVPWVKTYSRALETSWAVAVARAMFLWHVKLENATDKTVADFLTMLENQLVYRTDPEGNQYLTAATGQFLVTKKGDEIEAMSSDLRGGTIDPELRRLFLMGIISSGLPEFMMSDGDYSNLASSLSQSNPFFRLMESFQNTMVDQVIRGTFRLAFDQYAVAGINIPLLEDSEHPVDALNISAPKILTDDIESMIPPLVQAVNADLLSREDSAELLGRKWEDIAARIAAERAQGFAKAVPPAFPPATVSPGLFGAQKAMLAALKEEGLPTDDLSESGRARLTKMLQDYKKGLLASGGDKAAMVTAYREFKERAFAELRKAMDKAQTMGKESVGA
jgi:hypothetical protein